MKSLIVASAVALLMSGSLANAQFLLGQDENGHKQVRNLYAEQSQVDRRHAAPIPRRSAARIPQGGIDTATTTARRVSPGFLLGMGGGLHKKVENQYSGYAWPR